MQQTKFSSDPDLLLAYEVALAAGKSLLERPAVLDLDAKSTPTDIVTQMDKSAEALIVEALVNARPNDGLLGEEGAQRDAASGRTWIIDPIDGTINYLYELPFWCVSIGLHTSDGQGLVGVVHAPALDTTWLAAKNQGAWIIERGHHRPIQVSDQSDLAMSLMGTGFGYSSARRTSQARVLNSILPNVRDIRRLGSCALDLCLVAQGVLDGYYERGVHAWDHAAGSVIAREAGALIGGLRGQGEGNEMLVATNPYIYDELIALLELAQADQDDI